jgi:hypothetical protein
MKAIRIASVLVAAVTLCVPTIAAELDPIVIKVSDGWWLRPRAGVLTHSGHVGLQVLLQIQWDRIVSDHETMAKRATLMAPDS